MTPTQIRFADYLKARSPDWVTLEELRDACLPGRCLQTVYSHIWELRRAGVTVHTGKKKRGYAIAPRPDATKTIRGLTNRTADRILLHVSQRTGVSVSSIRGEGRAREMFVARRRAARLFRRLGYGLPEIGIAMNRHHTTILHHVGRASA